MNQRIRVVTFGFHAWIIYLITPLFVAVSAASEATKNDADEVIPFDLGTDLMVPVTVDGRSARFRLEISEPNTILDIGLINQLGPLQKVGLLSSSGSLGSAGEWARGRQAEFFKTPDLRIGNKRLDAFQGSKTIACVDVNLGVPDAHRFDGLLGMNYLKDTVLRIDSDKNRVEIKSRTDAPSVIELKCRLVGGVPTIQLRHPKEGVQSFQMLISSNGNLALNPELYNRLVQQGRIHAFPNEKFGQIGILDSIELGCYQFSNQLVVPSPSKYNYLGRRFLSRFNIEFDFPARMAYFQPSSTIQEPCWYSLSGLGYDARTGKRLIVILNSNGPGAKQGIRDGDELIAINERPAAQFSNYDFLKVFSSPGSEVQVTVQREGIDKDYILQMPNEPDPFPSLSLMIETTDHPDFPNP